ncbi:MAG: SusC/RagA family TonB-linked outer membrane protein [Paramuribaculum sp.]|nr:SusC/RagA family TonB-linked outer membrane protein [Paramuribaculum sp.]
MKKLFLLLTAIVTLALSASAQNRTYHGTVMSSADEEPLVGASVVPVGAQGGVITNLDGQFTITVPASVKEVKVTYLGMKEALAPLSEGMTVYLDNNATSLEGIVVTGYGSGKKLGSVVGAVSVVGQETFENTPSATFVDALQGQVAGLAIFSNSGDPSSVDNDVMIRGVNSIYASTTPLYILDGAPVSQSVFTTLNPSDIESITILKDAASVAIYGSRASNGVIVITSKKGRFGESAQVTVRANVGWGTKLPSNIKQMSSQQLLQFADMVAPWVGNPFTQDVYDLVDTYGISTDWTKEMFHTALTYSLEAAVQGGSDKFSYYLSLNHYDQDGIITQSGMHRETLRFALDSKVNNWFRVGAQGNLGYTKYETNTYSNTIYDNNIPNGPYIYTPSMYQYFARPWDSPYYYTFNDNGDMVFHDKAQYLHYTGAVTPDYLVSQADVNRNKVTVNAGLYEVLTPVRGLTLRAQQSVDAYDQRLSARNYPRLVQETPMGDIFPQSNPQPAVGEYMTGSAQESFARYYSFTYTNTAEYRFTVAEKNNFSILLGQESIISKSNSFGAYGTGYTDSRQMLLDQAPTVTPGSSISSSMSKTVMNSYFGNFSYDFDGRYFLDASVRRDGSSKFAPGHRWATFYAVGARWNMKAEKFLQNVKWLNELSVRGNYGTVGNSGIGNYLYWGLIGSTSNYGPTSQSVSGTGVSSPGNPNLTWERTASWDVGLNFRLFDRVSADVDVYKKKTTDLLMSIPWSYTTGFSSQMGNVGAMTNTGVEVDVKADLVRTADWYAGVRVNFAYNKNEITELFDGLSAYTIPNTGTRFEIGHPANEYYYAKYAGVDPRDGYQMWYTKEGNLTKQFNEEELEQFIGKSSVAPWNGGFGIDLRYKGFSIRTDWNWSAQKYLMNNNLRYVKGIDLYLQGMNQSVDMLNIWTHPGQITDIPVASQEPEFDDRYVSDASYLRLKNLTVAYALPRTALQKIGLKGLNFHFTGRNLWTITSFEGEDPEPSVNRVLFFYPNTRQYEFGFEVTF